MELRHLRYFVAVAEEENVSRAALKLHVSQPGISRQIRDLEDEIGFPLFERSAKSLRLTEAGKVLLTEARLVLAQTEAAVKKAREAAQGDEIHVGYAPSLTVQILPQALRKFQESHPRVRVTLHDLSSDEMFTRLGSKQLQVALTVKPEGRQAKGLTFQELARYQICVAVSPHHELAKLKEISLAQVVRENLVAYSRKDYPEYHDMLGELFAPTGRKPRVIAEHDGVTSIVAAVESGRGFALMPNCVACMVGPRLKLLPLKPAGPEISVGAVCLKEGASAAVQQFIAAASPAA
ncbi:MAG TPA: LysR substrate-binding domain-containing protein [Verrucomicrobiae bacterium]